MKVYHKNIMRNILKTPYSEGRNKLSVITGYASPPFILHLLQSMEELELSLIIGMAKHDSINIWDHNEFKKMMKLTGRLSIKYYIGKQPIHSNIYLWDSSLTVPELAFAGSANLTRNSFSNFQETVAEIKASEIINLFNMEEVISCTDNDVDQHIDLFYRSERNNIDTSAVGKMALKHKYVDLPLTTVRDTMAMHKKSGLNWGQREGREPNQAYIPVSKRNHSDNPGFFPPRGEQFTLLTDDGESFVCVMAQDYSKAIESSYDNSILGRYFRKRLDVAEGRFVKIEDLENYGRNFVRVYKIDNETYFMDFS